MRTAAALLLLASLGAALELPSGPLPEIDGVPGEEEWSGAAVIPHLGGRVRLRRAGGALCVAVEMKGPYRGERIDLHVSDPEGVNYVVHAFQPAAHEPRHPFAPLPPSFVRRSSWSLREKAPPRATRSCLFRARVMKEAAGWTAEFAIALDALDVSPERGVRFLLETAPAAGSGSRTRFTRTEPGVAGPAGWPPLQADWSAGDGEFRTPDEDRRRGFEIDIFMERLLRRAGRRPERTPLADALDGRMNRESVAALLDELDACLEADPHDLFAGYYRAYALRRAGRIDDAVGAVDALGRRFPEVAGYAPLVLERFELLMTLRRFEEARRAAMALGLEPLRALATRTEALWRRESDLRTRDRERGDLPRVLLRTAKGKMVVELFEEEAPQHVAHFLSLVEGGAYEGRVFTEVTGALRAAVAGEPLDYRLPEERHPRVHWLGTLAVPPGGSGFHLALRRTPVLDGRATVVGRVVDGLSVLRATGHGDEILEARVLRKRDHAYEFRKLPR